MKAPGAAFLLLALASAAAAGPAGREGFIFTSLSGDARGAALGLGAGALLDGGSALWGNPAAAALQLQYTAGITHLAWTDGFFGETLAATLPVGDAALIGVGGFLFLHDAVPVTSEILPDGTGALMRPVGADVRLLAAAFITEGLSWGGALRVAHEQFGDAKIEALALDCGFVWVPDPAVAIGLAMTGFGGTIQSRSNRDPFPMEFATTVRYEAGKKLPVPVAFYAGGSFPLWGPSGGGLGAEVGDWHGAFLRGSFDMREKGMFGWAVGVGGRRDQWNVDYTFAPAGDLGWAHRIGLTLRFSRQLKPAEATPL